MTKETVKSKALDIHKGHRKRLRDKMLAVDLLSDTINDYELLEFLLISSIPRCDVKPLAKLLIKEFTDLNGVLTAPVQDLIRVGGLKETSVATIKAAYLCSVRMAKNRVTSEALIKNIDDLLAYCHIAFAYGQEEKSVAFFLDIKGRLIKEEIISIGTINQTVVYPRELVRKALSCNASSIVLVHNHPSGSFQPSIEDKILTEDIKVVLNNTEIEFGDHIIVSPKGHFSFKEHRLL